MRKTSQDGGDSSSITSGIENEMKKPGTGILKMKRSSLKKKVQSFSIESDDAIIEPLLQKDKEKLNENQSAKYMLSKAKTESQSGGDTDKLLGDSKVSKPAISNIPCIANSSLLGNGTKESITPKSISSSTAIIHNHMNTNVFAGHDFVNSIASKTPVLVEIGSTKQSGYSPSPLIFTTAKIHTDGKSKHMEPVQVTPVPILSTIEGSIVKGANYEKYNVNSNRNDINSSGINAKPLTSVKDQPTIVPNSIVSNTVNSINADNFKANSNISTNATTSRANTSNTDNAYSVNKTNDSVAENTKKIFTNKLTDPNISHLGNKNDSTAKTENENKDLTKAAEKLALNVTANNKTAVSVTQNTSIDFNKNVESDVERLNASKNTIMCNTSDINISTNDSTKATDSTGSKSLLHQQDTLCTRVSPNSAPKLGTSVENKSFSNTTKDSNDISFPQAVLDSGKSKTEQGKLDAQNMIESNGSVSNSLKFPVTVSKTREQSGIGSACLVKSPVNSTKTIETPSNSEFGTEGKTLHTSAKPITTEIPSDKKTSITVSEARNKTSVPSEKPPTTTNISSADVSVTSSAKPASTISSIPLSTNKSNTNVSHNTKSGNTSVKTVSTTKSKTDSKPTSTTSKTITSKQPAMSTVKTITSSFPQPSKAKNSNFSNTPQTTKTPVASKKNDSLSSIKSPQTTSSSVPSKVSTVTTMKPMTTKTSSNESKTSSNESSSKNATATPSVSATPSAKVSVSNKKAESKANDYIKDGKGNKA